MDAKTADARTHEFDVQDVEYLRHGDKPLLARVFKPRGDGPFPAIVDLHGGAWCLSNRLSDKLRHECWRATATSWCRSTGGAAARAPIRRRSPTSTTRSAGSRRTPRS